ncbi:hypothetical protein [Streptomyces sp. NPDC015131]|uniref:hypothetical protein n=1 Tax=Streptomyces sp. NPDC015131 TaxID=3364941 RepID=UPI0036FB049F
MHGHGHAPPPPGRPADGTLVVLRTLFVAITVLSCGFLAWAPMVRLAVVTRRTLDWFLFCLLLLSMIGMFVFLASAVPADENQEMSDGSALAFGVWMILSVVGVTIYYLIAEIRHFGRAAAPVPSYDPPRPGGYGYPQAYPHPAPPQQTPPRQTPLPHQPAYHPQAPQHTPTPPPAARPTPQRIDRVRAELDQLSDLLRNDPGAGHPPRDPRDASDPRDPRDGTP